jgi:TRAP-type C4-dicarboxylate transport system permease small subunit
MSRLSRLATRAIDTLAIVSFCGMFLCVLGQVFFRYFLGSPLVWSDELGRYLFVWCAFLGWVIAARRRSHLAIAIGGERLPARVRGLLGLVGALAAVAFATVLAFYGVRIAARNWDVETTSLFFPVGVVYAIVPAAAIAVALHAVADARAALRKMLGARETAR